jgi:pimeloyl-ACP methyl ester carboxylesterase
MSLFTEHFTNMGFNAIAPDLRGYGKFRCDRAFTMQSHIDDLDQLLEERGIENCVVLGWSLGGILAMELALRSPQKIAGLILIASAARPRGSHPSTPWWESVNIVLAVICDRLFSTWAVGRKLSKWLGKRSLLKYLIQQHTDFAYQQVSHQGTSAALHTSKFATQALRAAMQKSYDLRAELPRIQIPCLVMAGECDRHITATSSHETADLLPNSTWICYPATAHLFPWEIPDQLLADCDRWLTANLT